MKWSIILGLWVIFNITPFPLKCMDFSSQSTEINTPDASLLLLQLNAYLKQLETLQNQPSVTLQETCFFLDSSFNEQKEHFLNLDYTDFLAPEDKLSKPLQETLPAPKKTAPSSHTRNRTFIFEKQAHFPGTVYTHNIEDKLREQIARSQNDHSAIYKIKELLNQYQGPTVLINLLTQQKITAQKTLKTPPLFVAAKDCSFECIKALLERALYLLNTPKNTLYTVNQLRTTLKQALENAAYVAQNNKEKNKIIPFLMVKAKLLQ
ncbi:MAG: hypothetical protein UV38_C0001G0045 [candidate division TM6 bacterium GW2011_GWE2_42_60]|nr:MAG: hypothetical protein UV38_C0001G0045 [candidate division TM6 bacterium GW2011_GWE2_42_60]